MSEQRNLILAIVLSAAVLFGWQYFIAGPQMAQEQARQAALAEQAAEIEGQAQGTIPILPREALPRDEALTQTPRVPIETLTVDGSVNLTGALLDDLRLRDYHLTPDPESGEIELFSPLNAEHSYFVDMGWFGPQGANYDLPGLQSEWAFSGGSLTPGSEVVLTYDGADGLIFTRRISIDERYMFTISDRVDNQSGAPVILYPYARIQRPDLPAIPSTWVVHDGFIGVADGVLQDPSYDELADGNLTERFESIGGWAGLTDKYWMSALIPDQQEEVSGSFRAFEYNGGTAYEANYEFEPRTIAPGTAQEITHRVFAGPKVVNIIEDYRDAYDIPLFDYAIDWGWFWFLTKPIFLSLDYIFRFVGNFGVAILVFTVFVKLLFYPLANTSYRAMGKMKKLQPEMEALRERFKDDKTQLQQGMMALYKKEKVNPLAGCLPILVQIPVFFSLYKVLFVTIEMRHAPFFGWIRDLSAIEPISIVNLFGLLPFTPPGFLMIGVFPIVMGLTMWIQMRLNPPPADPVQQRIFGLMPWFFMIMLASFPAGLVIYWTWNNILSIAQQAYIMRQSGVPIDLFDKLANRFKRGQTEENSAPPPD
jgi:YidC/Oxa1 family membrane protein insertase